MKNTRSYRFAAVLLAIIMVFGVLPVTAMAAPVTIGYYIYDATADAIISYTSDGHDVGSVEEMVPNKVSTMTVSVPDSQALPQNKSGETVVTLPDHLIVTAEDIAACQSDEVTCSYKATKNQLAFTWIGDKQSGFTATLSVTPNVPSTVGISGNYVISAAKANQPLIGALKAQTRANSRLVSSPMNKYGDQYIFDDNSEHIWSFNHITGDWYTISNGGQYVKMNAKALSLTDESNATVFHIKSEANGLVIESNGYYLNIQGDKVENGFQGSNWSPMGQWIKLLPVSSLFTGNVEDNNGYIKLSANGGSAGIAEDVLGAEIGATVKLPNYNGTKNGKQFIGWAKYSNIYDNHDGTDNSFCIVYVPGTEYTVSKGVTTLYAVFNEKDSAARFGIRKDGTIPREPGNHDAKLYYNYHETIQNGVKVGHWVVDVDGDKEVVGNHIENNVTANLNALPDDESIKKMTSTYDPETMYVHWYVLKYSGNQWKIDGVIRMRESKSVGYDMNMNTSDRSRIQNMPSGFEYGQKTTITVGAESIDGQAKTPSLAGYEFLGWNTKANGTGTAYQSGDKVEVSEAVTFYAQWKEIPKHEVSYTIENAPRGIKVPDPVKYLEDGTVELAEAKNVRGYIFSGWMIDGEKIEEDSFIMQQDDVEITGTYYGPIDIRITCDWQEGQYGQVGAEVNLTAVLEGPDNLEYDIQWQYEDDGSTWIDVPGATDYVYTYKLSDENSGRIWRVVVTDVRKKQE